MANTTSKSSKAKTKTSKKPAAKATVKTAHVTKAVKPVAKVTKAASAPKKPVKVATVKRAGLLVRLANKVKATGLRRLHGTSAIIFVILGIVAGAFMKTTDYQLSLGYAIKDGLLGTFVPAQHVFTSVDLRWVVVGVMALSALFSIARMTRLSATEDKGLKVRIQPWRWVDLAITGAAMLSTTALLYGVQDIATLKLTGALTVFALVLAWIAERENSGAAKIVKGAFFASVLAGLVIFLVLALHGWSTVVYGDIRSPWYAYALFGTSIVTAALLGINQYLGFRGKKAWSNYLFVERNYLLVNLVAKVAFAAILIVGLYNY